VASHDGLLFGLFSLAGDATFPHGAPWDAYHMPWDASRRARNSWENSDRTAIVTAEHARFVPVYSLPRPRSVMRASEQVGGSAER
jgi:hypothetical protein